MSKKLLFCLVLFFSVFVLSSCDRLEEAKSEFSEKITGTSEKRLDALTDDQLLEELESGTEINVDADFSRLEAELGQL